LFDPVSFSDDRHSLCDIYMQCKNVEVFYGGKYGSIYQRIPCAMGGTLFAEESTKYPVPEVPSTFWKMVPGVRGMAPNPDALPGAPAHRRRRVANPRNKNIVLRNGVEYICPPEEVESGHVDITKCNVTHAWGSPKNVKQPCRDDLVGHGLGQKQIVRDENISASSYWSDGTKESVLLHGKGEMWRSRILDETPADQHTSWRANVDDDRQWIQWDFGSTMHVKEIETQPAARTDMAVFDSDWVKRYRIEYFLNGKWIKYKEELTGNKRPEGIQIEVLNPAIWADSVRLIPTSWHNHVSMRAGLIGCGPNDPAFPHPPGPPTPQSLSLATGTAKKSAAAQSALDALTDELNKLQRQSQSEVSYSLLAQGRPDSVYQTEESGSPTVDKDADLDKTNTTSIELENAVKRMRNDLSPDEQTDASNDMMDAEIKKKEELPENFDPFKTGFQPNNTAHPVDSALNGSKPLLDGAEQDLKDLQTTTSRP